MTDTDTRKTQTGLTEAQVLESRAKYGDNVLTPVKRKSPWLLFADKFRDPLIIVLLVAEAVSIGISIYEYKSLGMGPGVFFEPVGILAAIILATGLAFLFEWKADREFAILNTVSDDDPVRVIRDGSVTQVPKRDIVVGDIVLLDTGVEIPADGTLLQATSMTVDESTLTGEPSCDKTTDPEHFDKEATFPSNRVLRGTKVLGGHGIMEVTAVGDATENGSVFQASQIDDHVKTPLSEQLDRLGHMITKIAYGVAIAVVVGRLVMYFLTFDFDWLTFMAYMLQTLMLAIALIVVSVPEGLPMAVTLSLAYSMRRMLHTNNLVRKLHACETMGATTVICTDKTGTLTQNKMQVAQTRFFGDPSDRTIELAIAANSTAQLDTTQKNGDTPEVLGNPTEGALLLWLWKRGVDYSKVRESVTVNAELPFSTERKYMAMVVTDQKGQRLLFVKGAPEIVYSLCQDRSGLDRAEFGTLLSGYQNQAMRTLGFAYQRLEDEDIAIEDDKVVAKRLKFMGVAAISDPVRADVPDAVAQVTGAGIRIKIVTGDTTGTAKEIGRQIGLWDDSKDTDANIVTGPEFEAIPDSELPKRAEEIKIIARARPMDKKRLVEALQSQNEVVAVTGDGTNDAPALKAAHVGLSMGDGTAVAKEASDITIIDNSFASIGRAVMWGRSLYLNIQRFILFQLTVNVVACLIMLVGSFLGTQSPLTVTQMLWVNLIMDTFAAMALASLPPSRSVMLDKPRDRRAFIITHNMWRDILGAGGAMFVALMALLVLLEHSSVESLTHTSAFVWQSVGHLTPYELTVFFTVFVFMQFWNMFNARAYATGRSALHLSHCGGFVFIALMILIGQILIVTVGGAFFSVVPLRLTDWATIIVATSLVFWIGEGLRALRR